MEHVHIAFGVSSDASDPTQMKVLDRPVFDHHEFATERFFMVLIQTHLSNTVVLAKLPTI